MKTLYIFVDESGNFDFSPTGTKYFILTLLTTMDPSRIGTYLMKLRYLLLPNYACGQRMEERGYFHALKIRHRDFYHTRHTFISVMLSHGENPKHIAEYMGNSPEVIYRSYGKWIGGHEGFGKAALQAAKPEPLPKPFELPDMGNELKQVVGMVRGGGFEPPRHFWH
jgi:hypothetical protein